MKFVQPEQPQSKSAEVSRFVALERHPRRDLQTLRGELAAILHVLPIGIADDHARRMESIGGNALETPGDQ